MIFYLCIYLSTISRGVQTTVLIPLVVKASETLRENPRINDPKALDIIRHLNIDTVIVNIGASFDNRFSRVDNGKISRSQNSREIGIIGSKK